MHCSEGFVREVFLDPNEAKFDAPREGGHVLFRFDVLALLRFEIWANNPLTNGICAPLEDRPAVPSYPDVNVDDEK
jgi:hypothetical protein